MQYFMNKCMDQYKLCMVHLVLFQGGVGLGAGWGGNAPGFIPGWGVGWGGDALGFIPGWGGGLGW